MPRGRLLERSSRAVDFENRYATKDGGWRCCCGARTPTVARSTRVSDFVARYGGEEFAALLPACSPDEAIVVLERMRLAIAHGQTCSASVAYWDAQESPEALIGRADAALYEAKRAGRDRIVTAS
jgi:diguanylate cyclase (GGDEF)-like protein